MPSFKDLTNQRFGRLIVISRGENKIYGNNKRRTRIRWNCLCDCGKTTLVSANKLASGRTQSCGCLRTELIVNRRSTHKLSDSLFYKIWRAIKNRCLREKDQAYKDYGGRGITVCKEWLSFENFRDDMYESYLNHAEEFGERNTSIDRINNNGHYCKENCKWATRLEQANNTRRNRYFEAISPDGEKYIARSQSLFAKEHGLTRRSICHVLHCQKKHEQGWKFKFIDEEI